ncbi:MAG TPA: ABC transporter substrate-binding protein [Actinomycetota bacterium]|nr:ABC transporter substrate-binding protein [Actinomycetota bacterium]
MVDSRPLARRGRWRPPAGTVQVVDPSPRNWLHVVGHVLEGPLRADLDGRPVAALAAAARWLDGHTLELDLRAGVCFQDGRPLGPAEVKRSFDELQRWAAPYPMGPWLGFPSSATCEVAGERTIRLRLPAPDGLALGRLCLLPVATPAFWDDPGFGYREHGSGEGRWGLLDGPGPFGTGPFVLAEGASSLATAPVMAGGDPRALAWLATAEQRSPRVVLEANRAYWDAARGPRVERIVFRNHLPADEALERCCSSEGEVDVVTEVAPADAARVTASPFARLLAVDADRVLVGVVNRAAQGAPLDDPRARHALNLAVNRERLVAEGFAGHASPLAGLTPPGRLGASAELAAWPHDPARALTLLRDAAWPADRPLRLAAAAALEVPARLVAEDLGDALGLDVDLQILPPGRLLAETRRLAERRLTPAWDVLLTICAGLAGFPFPAAVHRELFGADGLLRAGPELPGFDARYTELAAETDPARIAKAAERLDRWVHREALALFLCAPKALYAVNRHVTLPSSRAGLDLTGAEAGPQHWSRCAPGAKVLAGTVEGQDGRALNALVGVHAFDARGQRLDAEGAPAPPGLPWTATVRLNQDLPAEGRDPRIGDVTTFSVQLPAATERGTVEVHPRSPAGLTVQTRYASARLPFEGGGPWPELALELPMTCPDSPNGTGRVGGSLRAASVPVLGTSGTAWALGPNPDGVWGFAAGSVFTPGSYTTQELAAGARYEVRVTYNHLTARTTGVAVRACATTALDLDFVGDGLPAQSVVRRADGLAQQFVRRPDGELVTSVEDPAWPDGWTPLASLGATVTSGPSAARLADGRLAVMARMAGDVPACLVETRAGGTWGAWRVLPGVAVRSQLALLAHADGSLDAYVRGDDDHLFRSRRNPAGLWGIWQDLGGRLATEPVGVLHPDGRVEILAVAAAGTADDQAPASGAGMILAQPAPGKAFGEWTSLGGELTVTPAVALGPDGALEVISRMPLGAVCSNRRGPNGAWSGWHTLGDGGTQVRSGVTLARRADSRLEVAAWGGDDVARRLVLNADGGVAVDWTVLAPGMVLPDGVSTYLASPPALGRASDGLVAWMRSASGHLCRSSSRPGGDWAQWVPSR